MLESPLRLRVQGRPRPQGSVKARGNGTVEYSATTLQWRAVVTEKVLRVLGGRGAFQALSGPVVAAVEFGLDGDPIEPPDLDKLVRAIGDALTDGGVWLDDSQVVGWSAWKRRTAPGEPEGVRITLEG